MMKFASHSYPRACAGKGFTLLQICLCGWAGQAAQGNPDGLCLAESGRTTGSGRFIERNDFVMKKSGSPKVKPTSKSSFPAGAGKANQMGRKKIGRYENAFLATACFILSA